MTGHKGELIETEQGEEIAEIHLFRNKASRWEVWIENTQYPNRSREEVENILLNLIQRKEKQYLTQSVS